MRILFLDQSFDLLIDCWTTVIHTVIHHWTFFSPLTIQKLLLSHDETHYSILWQGMVYALRHLKYFTIMYIHVVFYKISPYYVTQNVGDIVVYKCFDQQFSLKLIAICGDLHKVSPSSVLPAMSIQSDLCMTP